MSERTALHLTDAQLDDLVDGALDADARAEAERHLERCIRCRHAMERTRALAAWVERERATVVAPPELWPLVSASTIYAAITRRRVIASMRGMLIAGALALVAATALVTWKVAHWSMTPRSAATGTAPMAPRAPVPPIAPIPSMPSGPSDAPGSPGYHAGHAGHPISALQR